MIPFLETAVAAIVWLVANVVYIDLKRKGVRGFTRFAAFWVGTPTTWISLFAIHEGDTPTFAPSPDDEDAVLLAEVRRDRALRGGDVLPDLRPAPAESLRDADDADRDDRWDHGPAPEGANE
jgi:hypothetical protein